MKGIYLGAFEALHKGHDIVYQDINGKRDLPGDMMDIDLTSYDYIIATPPCNFWSRANYRRYESNYSMKTRLLLPYILQKLIYIGKPFIVENVINKPLMSKYFDIDCCYRFEYGEHTYWTNILFPLEFIEQHKQNKKNISRNKRQGGINVHNVIETFIKVVEGTYY